MKKNISKFIAVLLPALLASQVASVPAYAIHDPASYDTQVVGATLSDQYLNAGGSGINYALCADLSDTALEACILAAQEAYLAETGGSGDSGSDSGESAVVTPETTPPTVPETTVPETTLPETTIPETTLPVLTIPDTKTSTAVVPDTSTPAVVPDGEVLGVSKVREETGSPTQQKQPGLSPNKDQIDNLHLQISTLKNGLDKSNNVARIYLLLIMLALGIAVIAFFIGWYLRKIYYEKKEKLTVKKTKKARFKKIK